MTNFEYCGQNPGCETWGSYALKKRRTFLKVHGKMKTLRFALSVLKIRECNTLKAWMQNKKCRADVTITIWSIWRCVGSPRRIYNGSWIIFFLKETAKEGSTTIWMGGRWSWWDWIHFSDGSSRTSWCTIRGFFENMKLTYKRSLNEITHKWDFGNQRYYRWLTTIYNIIV